MRKLICILGMLASAMVLFEVGSVSCGFFDHEQASGNAFGAWVSTQWTQTTSADFQAGSGNVDISSGNVALLPILDLLGIVVGYDSPGVLSSQVLDTGKAGSVVDALIWDETLVSTTDITFKVRASDTPFARDDSSPSWVSVGGTSPVLSGLPHGRYIQWQATLTQDTLLGLLGGTPTLREVRLYYH